MAQPCTRDDCAVKKFLFICCFDYSSMDVSCSFQNIVFALKFFLDYIIPDVPKDVTRAMRRVRHPLF